MYKLLAVSPFVCFCQAELILGISVVCVVSLFNLPCVRAEGRGGAGVRSLWFVRHSTHSTTDHREKKGVSRSESP